MKPQLEVPLTIHPLTFHCRAEEPILWSPFKGSAVRGAFAGILRHTFCPEWRGTDKQASIATASLHTQVCPVCQLLAKPKEEEFSGDLRRPYAIRPPLDTRTRYEAGDPFAFTVTLFGNYLDYLPYLALGVEGMGAAGIGSKNGQGRRGRFSVESITSTNSLTKATAFLMKPKERIVEAITAPVDNTHIIAAAEELAAQLKEKGNRLILNFATPTRLIKRRGKIGTPEPFQFIKHAVRRVLDLSTQYGAGRPTIDGQLNLKRDVFPYADAVTLIKDETRWWDVSGYSGRMQQQQKLGGFVGSATYTAPDWRPLLPWLLWATQVQVGKNTVKGCGVITGTWRE